MEGGSRLLEAHEVIESDDLCAHEYATLVGFRRQHTWSCQYEVVLRPLNEFKRVQATSSESTILLVRDRTADRVEFNEDEESGSSRTTETNDYQVDWDGTV